MKKLTIALLLITPFMANASAGSGEIKPPLLDVIYDILTDGGKRPPPTINSGTGGKQPPPI